MSEDIIGPLLERPMNELWVQPQEEREAMQADALTRLFEFQLPRISQLAKLANLQKIESISSIEDVAPLLFQHTAYKSYPVSLLEKGRFDLLTKWLDGLTTHDLSGIDASSCDSIDSWFDVLEANSPLRPSHSTGTTGKLSIIPRDTADLERFVQARVKGFTEPAFGDEPARFEGLLEGNRPIPIVNPSYRYGRHVAQRMLQGLVDNIGSEAKTYSLYNDFMSADVASLAGRVRGASMSGTLDDFDISPDLLKRFKTSLERQANQASDQEAFFERVLADLQGETVLVMGAVPFLFAWTALGEARGLENLFAPDSVVQSGGGLKGATLPDDWLPRIEHFLGAKLRLGYGMSELISGHAACSKGQYHVSPLAIPFVLDPESGAVLPRTGTQTGRYAFFDLQAGSYWGGFVTGDRITLTWDECGCGRTGPHIHPTIERFSELEGGDDKISCSGSNDAHEEAMAWLTARAEEVQ